MAAGAPVYDVIVIGGGPAGSTLAWALARRDVRVLVLERTRFPREKVCGDYVDPRGLRILEEMGCLAELEERGPLPITHSAMFVEGRRCYAGEILSYSVEDHLPPHAYVIPRDELDTAMLAAAERQGVTVHQETLVTGVEARKSGVRVEARRNGEVVRYRSRLVAGADGANSVVGTSSGQLGDDPRHTAVAQRAYATGFEANGGEVVCFFDEALFPGYGWVFPMADGRVNLGVGILAETRQRLDLNVPGLFADFVARLREHHPRCGSLELCSSPIGGVVRTYGGAGANRFDGGVLVGDAGSFVDPMTGEGITQGAESALLAAPVLVNAIESGRCDAEQLAAYEDAFRAYFDPAMTFLDLCAALLRNRWLARPWLNAFARGCELARGDAEFARISSSYFGGLDIRPFGIVSSVWARLVEELLLSWPRALGLRPREDGSHPTSVTDLAEWQAAWSRSFLADPLWHTSWSWDVQRKALRVLSSRPEPDPRATGLPATP